MSRYFGDTAPGVATARFHAAVDHLLVEWERHASLHAAELLEAEAEGRIEDQRDAARGIVDDGTDPED